MLFRTLRIGRWTVVFIFAHDGYDADSVLEWLHDVDAPPSVMRRADEIMGSGALNRGFTYANPMLRRAVVVIGPTTSGRQFQNTFSHEIDHLSDQIAEYYGLKGSREATAYLTGDTTMALSDVICRLGCERCREGRDLRINK